MRQKRIIKNNWHFSISIVLIVIMVLLIPYLKTESKTSYHVDGIEVNILDETHIKIKGRLNETAGVREVYFPTWRIENNQEDLNWWKGERNGTEISVIIDMGAYEYRPGDYMTHIYVVDANGCIQAAEVPFQYKGKESHPTSKADIFQDNSGYRVTYKNLDSNRIAYVDFPTWTESDGQDDLIWYRAKRGEDHTFLYDVRRENHGNETGNYYTDIYAHYIDGTIVTDRLKVTLEESLGRVHSASIEINEDGNNFIVATQISPKKYYVVDYAVWTEANGQDDIIWRRSMISQDDHYFLIGKRSEHNNELDIYHIHAYIKNAEGKTSVFETKIDYRKPIPKLISVESKNITDQSFDVVYKVEMPEGIHMKSAICPTWSNTYVPPTVIWNNPKIEQNGNTITITCHHEATEGKRIYTSHLHLLDNLERKIIFGTKVNLK